MNDLKLLNIIAGALLLVICIVGIAVKRFLKKKLEDIDGVDNIYIHSDDEDNFIK